MIFGPGHVLAKKEKLCHKHMYPESEHEASLSSFADKYFNVVPDAVLPKIIP